MKITRLQDVEKVPVDMEGARNAFRQVPISGHDGAPNFSFRVFTLEPEGHTPYHTHGFEHLNYIISGQGTLVDGDGARHELAAGDFALVLPGEKHQYQNTSGSEPFVMICAVPKAYE
jgi:quercetin dioxygenase-like cupin family protein